VRSRPPFLLPALLAACLLAAPGCVLGPKESVRFDPRKDKLGQAETVEVDRRTPLPDDLRRPDGAYLLGPGDEIVVYRLNARPDDPNGSLKTFVMPDGMVYYDLAPPVQARGKTVADLAAALTEALRPFYRQPEVSVALHAAKSRRYSVLGKVYSPDVYALDQPTTLLDAIARAGGLELAGGTGTTEELADLSRSILVRNGKILPVDFEALVRAGDVRYNVYVKDQDVIFLPPKSTKEILVLGHVGTPKATGWREGMGLVGAIAEARGTKPGAYVQRVLLVRDSFTRPRVAILNLDSISKGKQSDVAVLPGDIIWVPRGPWERIERYIDLVIGTAANTFAANEGVRLATGEQSAAVSVQIPITGGSGAAQVPTVIEAVP
jgi:polysaccharide export outer membrane protein